MPDIKNLPVNCLYQHPDNPRKALGDLTELADSIKANGILQNLTVIPANQVAAVWNEICKMPQEEIPAEAYVVIIGHRRLAAAKEAGLTEVPCAVTSMTPQEQIRTMLIENMQRSELTPYEQAQGFQMMLDLGDTVETIARDSGFSESTVRSRVKLLKFDDKTFREATEKQITLETLSEVAKIENAKTRDKVLAAYGSNNFQWDLNNAINTQKAKKNAPAAKKEILAYAKEVPEVKYTEYDHVMSVQFCRYTPGSATPKDLKKGAEYIVHFSPGSAAIYVKRNVKRKKTRAKKKSKAEQEKEAEIKRRESELKDLTESAYNLRHAFAQSLSVSKADYPKLMKHAYRVLIACKIQYYGSDFAGKFEEFLGLEKPKGSLPYEICNYLTNEADKLDSCTKPLIAAIY
ncbi:MAG: ParB/RepB/Spo0J family partition protein, partial [Oscillibacter sp.]|nr:ParB/RepB/Spo0J family partition protein [Oscillibacter sp.]